MKYPKQLVSGKDINLSKYNLGIIRQPRVDDFMDDYDLQDFIKSFYIEQSWRVNGVFDDKDLPFTFFMIACGQNAEIGESLIKSLVLLYQTEDFVISPTGDNILIKKDKKAQEEQNYLKKVCEEKGLKYKEINELFCIKVNGKMPCF